MEYRVACGEYYNEMQQAAFECLKDKIHKETNAFDISRSIKKEETYSEWAHRIECEYYSMIQRINIIADNYESLVNHSLLQKPWSMVIEKQSELQINTLKEVRCSIIAKLVVTIVVACAIIGLMFFIPDWVVNECNPDSFYAMVYSLSFAAAFLFQIATIIIAYRIINPLLEQLRQICGLLFKISMGMMVTNDEINMKMKR